MYTCVFVNSERLTQLPVHREQDQLGKLLESVLLTPVSVNYLFSVITCCHLFAITNTLASQPLSQKDYSYVRRLPLANKAMVLFKLRNISLFE